MVGIQSNSIIGFKSQFSFRRGILVIAILIANKIFVIAQNSNKNELSIVIKDDGIVELKKGDVALIFYITVTNTGHDSLRLSVNSTKCCQKFEVAEEDCESMSPFGGDMGKLYPQDTRNLTLIYPTLYAHDRAGSCEMEIVSEDGKKVERTVKFNTTLPRSSDVRVPRLLEQYYNPEDLIKCEHFDQDPLNLCRSVACVNKYTGHKNFFNQSTYKCEKLPKCVSTTKGFPDVAYVVETNSCHDLKNELTEEEKAEFHEGKPGIHELTHLHRYPMNLRCHQGALNEEDTKCICNKGWMSAPFDPSSFNFDVQIYHMCTVWTGEMTAKEAANITVVPKEKHKFTSYIIFSVIGGLFVIVAFSLGICVFIRSRKPKISEEGAEEGESLKLVTLEGDEEEADDDEEEGEK